MPRQDKPDVEEPLTFRQVTQAVAEWLGRNRGMPMGDYHEGLSIVMNDHMVFRFWRKPPPAESAT